MLRKRMISPIVWQDHRFARLTLVEQHIYIGLICCCDDLGRFEAEPGLIKRTLWPRTNKPRPNTVQKKVKAIEDAGLIQLYESEDGRLIGSIPNWSRLQDLNAMQKGRNTVLRSDLPPPPALDGRDTNESKIKESEGSGKEDSSRPPGVTRNLSLPPPQKPETPVPINTNTSQRRKESAS